MALEEIQKIAKCGETSPFFYTNSSQDFSSLHSPNIDFINEPDANQFRVILWKADDKPTINAIESLIIEFLKNNGPSPSSAIAKNIGKKITQTKTYLHRLEDLGLVKTAGQNKNRTYSL